MTVLPSRSTQVKPSLTVGVVSDFAGELASDASKVASKNSKPSLTVGLIAHFPFDEDFKDHSGNKNHGRPFNGPKLKKGVIGFAASFDGKDDFVSVLPKSDVSKIGDFSLSVWTYLEKWKDGKRAGPRARDYQYIFDGISASPMFREDSFYGPGFFAVYGLADRPKLEAVDGPIRPIRGGEPIHGGEEIHNGVHLLPGSKWYWEQNIPAKLKGCWRHMVFLRKGGEDVTYLDGKRQKSAHAYANKHARTLNMQHPWFIGTYSGNDTDYKGITSGINYSFHGRLDDMRIYNRALSDKEVELLFQLRDTKPNQDIGK